MVGWMEKREGEREEERSTSKLTFQKRRERKKGKKIALFGFTFFSVAKKEKASDFPYLFSLFGVGDDV